MRNVDGNSFSSKKNFLLETEKYSRIPFQESTRQLWCRFTNFCGAENHITVPLNMEQRISNEIANEISGIDDPESPYSVLIIKKKSLFEIQYDLLRQKIQGWETRQMIPKAESDDAIKILNELGKMNQSLKCQTDALCGQIIELQHQLALESKSRIETETIMTDRISHLERDRICQSEKISKLERDRICESEKISHLERENSQLVHDRICERELMLIRALATSFQYALTQKFPGLFTTHFPYACTFNDISKKVSKQSNVTWDTTLQDVTNIFLSHGTDAEDINPLIKVIRELGTRSSHVTIMIDANGNQRKPSAKELLEIIDHSPLHPDIKSACIGKVGCE
jgi:hypothetical protein